MKKKQNTENIDEKGNYRGLRPLGWSAHFERQMEPFAEGEWVPARVIGVRKNSFLVGNGQREWRVTLAGKFRHHSAETVPVTGDWVLVYETLISAVLDRKNALSRGAAGTRGKEDAQPHREQVIAANLDTVFIVCGLDRDFNLRRIERYLTLVYNGGIRPVIILTKADLHPDPESFAREVETVAIGVPIHLVSAVDHTGVADLEQYLSPGQTTTMVGSSGAGKSTLVNRLYGKNVQTTGAISSSVGKGRHTTTNRDLIVMPQGGMVIDNPGIREIAFWMDDGGSEAAFPDIEALAGECLFSDCSHTHEPGCRVLQAVGEGEISPDRINSYRKIRREMAYLARRRNKSADRVEKERWKEVALKIKAMKKKR